MKRRASRPISSLGRYEKKKRFIGPIPRNIGGGYQAGVMNNVGSNRGELKAFDLAGAQSLSFVAAGSFQTVNFPVNGAELYQRVGRKIYMKSLHIRGYITPSGFGVTVASDLARVMVIYDQQPNGAVPNIASVLQYSNAGSASNGYSEINLTNRSRFRILRDFMMVTPPIQSGVPSYNPSDQTKDFSVDMFIKLKGLETEFNGTNGGTIADITTGSIFVLCLDTLNQGVWGLNFASRLRYYDT